MGYIDRVNQITAAKKKEQMGKKAKAGKTPKTLAFDYFEAEAKLKALKGKDSWQHKKTSTLVAKLKKELDKTNMSKQKLDVFYKDFLKGKVK